MPVAPIYSLPKMVRHPSEQLVASLCTEVEAALWSYMPLRSAEAAIDVAAEEGRVVLTGTVRGAAHKAMAGRLAAAVPGVTAVDNRLIADSELEAEVARALAVDPDTSDVAPGLRTRCLRGIAYLSGRVAVAEPTRVVPLLDRIVEVAGNVAGVLEVVQRIEVADG